MKRKRVCAIIEMNGKILLARHFSNSKYALLGGGLKKDEDSLKAIKREISEETKLRLSQIKFLFEFDTFFQKHLVFYAKASGKPNLNWEIGELGYLGKGLRLNSTTEKILNLWKNNSKFPKTKLYKPNLAINN